MNIASRALQTLSDVTLGTVIVLWHVALADREQEKQQRRVRERDPRRLPS